MRTYIGTHVTLDTFAAVPNRNLYSDPALLIFGGSRRHRPVRKICKLADRNGVTVHGIHRNLNVPDPLGQVLIHSLRLNLKGSPTGGHLHLLNHQNALVHSRVVHIHHLLALSLIHIYWQLYRYNPERSDEGKNPFTLDSKEPSGDFRAFLRGEVRYSSLERTFPEEAESLFERTEKEAMARYAKYKALAQ